MIIKIGHMREVKVGDNKRICAYGAVDLYEEVHSDWNPPLSGHSQPFSDRVYVEMTDLPNDILSAILNRIELQSLVHLRSVSTNWNTVILGITREIRSLKLFDSFPEDRTPASAGLRYYRDFYLDFLDTKDYRKNCLKKGEVLKLRERMKYDRLGFLNFLTRLFPEVEDLTLGREVFLDENTDWFLYGWPRNLKNLTLVGHRLRPGFDLNFTSFLNSKDKLRHLNLLFHYIKNKTNIRPLKDTLSKLESFGCKVHADIKPILSLLGPNCTRLQLGYVSHQFGSSDDGANNNKNFFDWFKLRKAMPAKLAKQLTHLVLTEFYDEDMLDRYIYKELSNLKFLTLRCVDYKRDVSRPMDLHRLLPPSIIHARNLHELKLLKINFTLDFVHTSSQSPPSNIKSLSVLKLDYSGQNVEGFCSANWCEKLANIFPNLKRLIAKQPYDDGSFREEVERNKGLFEFAEEVRVISTELERVN